VRSPLQLPKKVEGSARLSEPHRKVFLKSAQNVGSAASSGVERWLLIFRPSFPTEKGRRAKRDANFAAAKVSGSRTRAEPRGVKAELEEERAGRRIFCTLLRSEGPKRWILRRRQMQIGFSLSDRERRESGRRTTGASTLARIEKGAPSRPLSFVSCSAAMIGGLVKRVSPPPHPFPAGQPRSERASAQFFFSC